MSNKGNNEIPEWVNDAVDRDSTLDEMIDSFINSTVEFVRDRRIIALYRKITGKPEVIDLITFSEEQMIEKYGSSDISKLTHLVGDVRWREFSSKMENLRKSSLPVDRTAVIQLIEELKQQGLFRVE